MGIKRVLEEIITRLERIKKNRRSEVSDKALLHSRLLLEQAKLVKKYRKADAIEASWEILNESGRKLGIFKNLGLDEKERRDFKTFLTPDSLKNMIETVDDF